MSSFIFRRLILMVPTLFMISLISFVIIELPPGDYMTSYIANRMAMGDDVRQDESMRLSSSTVSTSPRRYVIPSGWATSCRAISASPSNGSCL